MPPPARRPPHHRYVVCIQTDTRCQTLSLLPRARSPSRPDQARRGAATQLCYPALLCSKALANMLSLSTARPCLNQDHHHRPSRATSFVDSRPRSALPPQHRTSRPSPNLHATRPSARSPSSASPKPRPQRRLQTTSPQPSSGRRRCEREGSSLHRPARRAGSATPRVS